MTTISNTTIARLQSHRELTEEKSRRELARLREALLNNCDIDKANGIYSRLCDFSQTQLVMRDVSNELVSSQSDVPEFVVGSKLLYDAFNKMCAFSTESILYASGGVLRNSYSIERLIDLQLDESELGYASANAEFSSKVLIGLETYGTLLTCYFHTHPGRGKNANHPSSIDFANQARLEKGNYKTIGGIFARDGYLRFFSDKLDFNVTITGKGVQYVSKNVYKLTEIS